MTRTLPILLLSSTLCLLSVTQVRAQSPDFSSQSIQTIDAMICTQEGTLQRYQSLGWNKGPASAQLATAQSQINTMKQIHQQRTGEPFKSSLLCRSVKVAGIEEPMTLVNIQSSICSNMLLRASNEQMIALAKRSPGMQNQAQQFEGQVNFRALEEENGRLTAAFVKAAKRPPNLEGCQGTSTQATTTDQPKTQPESNDRERWDFKFADFYLLSRNNIKMKVLGTDIECSNIGTHYFVGVVVQLGNDKGFHSFTTYTGEADAAADDEVTATDTAFFKSKYNAGELSASSDSYYSISNYDTYLNAMDTAKKAGKMSSAGFNAGATVTPFTIGYSKPCYLGSQRIWQAIKKAGPQH